jgi:hypothetical protein
MICNRSVVSMVLSHVPQLEMEARGGHARWLVTRLIINFDLVLIPSLPTVLRYPVRTCPYRSGPLGDLGRASSDMLKS